MLRKIVLGFAAAVAITALVPSIASAGGKGGHGGHHGGHHGHHHGHHGHHHGHHHHGHRYFGGSSFYVANNSCWQRQVFDTYRGPRVRVVNVCNVYGSY